jgi:ATP-dependent DNA helicase RecG
MSFLTQDASIGEVDRRLAQRRTGSRSRDRPTAEDVLRDAFGITTVGQLLRHYPRRYIDRSATVPIRDVRFNQYVTVIGRVARVNQRRTRRGQAMVTITIFDGSGYLDLTFFNQPWIASQYKQGVELAVSGLAQSYRGRLQLANQEVEVLRGADAQTVHTGRITPVHPAADGISTRTIRELVYAAFQGLGPIAEALPAEVVAAEGLIGEDRALRAIHFPEDDRALAAATDRLKFDELFTLELGVAYRKRRLERAAEGIVQGEDRLVEPFLADLPFRPTDGQRAAIAEVLADMSAPEPMNRLLQGDVGSGKTVVALAAAMRAIGSGHQATIMAPTEVLAGQHVRTAAALLEPLGAVDARAEPIGGRAGRVAEDQTSLFGERGAREPAGPRVGTSGRSPEEGKAARRIRYALLSASVTGRERQRTLTGIADGSIDLVIGTHALVQEGVAFADLSLAVIDEQHRFGVHQRITLKAKGAGASEEASVADARGREPDVLIMTATPIPRTLALTYYGDLDVSVLDELPAGRRPVETRVARTAADRRGAYELVREQVREGRQAFVVCAAIDEGNRADVRAAEAEAERLRTDVFPDLRIELLHGRMRPPEKEAAMEDFRAGAADVLIATTVIEVGVDVPNATVMLVENAERFGLAQLHQLRGRIGRGVHRSSCVLFDESGPENTEARERLDAMERTNDGFDLADVDLRLRGEGTLFDVRQSGMPDLRLARLAEDADLVGRARTRAFALIDDDPGLEAHPELERLLRSTFSGDAIDWLFHS